MTSASCSSSRIRFFASRSSADSGGDARPDTVLDVGQAEPAVQTGLGDPEVLRDLRDWRLALPGHRHDVTTELWGERLGMKNILPARTNPHRQGVN